MNTKSCRRCGSLITRESDPFNFHVRKYCSVACRNAGRFRPMDPRLAPGETIIPACKDCIPCACPATFESTGVPCLHIGRDKATGIDRCLGCGQRWRTRTYRWEPIVPVGEAVAA